MAAITDCGQSALRYEVNWGFFLYSASELEEKLAPGGIIHATFSYWRGVWALDRSLEFPVEEWREDAEEELEALIWLAQREMNGVMRKQPPHSCRKQPERPESAFVLSLTVISKVICFLELQFPDMLKLGESMAIYFLTTRCQYFLHTEQRINMRLHRGGRKNPAIAKEQCCLLTFLWPTHMRAHTHAHKTICIICTSHLSSPTVS